MQKVLVIVTKNGKSYQLGLDKSPSQVINEITACKSDYYLVADTCAIKVDEISSVEQFEFDPKEVQKDDQAENNNA